MSRTASGAVFGISFGLQSLQPPLWAQPFCDSPIVRIRPCTGWDWIVLDRSIYPFVLASKKRKLVDAAHDLVRCERPSYKEAYGRRSTTATIAGSGWPVPGRNFREFETPAHLCLSLRYRWLADQAWVSVQESNVLSLRMLRQSALALVPSHF